MREYHRLFIDGRWQQPVGQGMAEVIDPASEAVAGRVPLGNEDDVERAVNAARQAFADWSRTPSSVRAGYIRALAGQLKARADEMAAVITTELGMPVQWCRSVQVDGPIVGLEQYIQLAGLMDEVREVGNSLVYREAVGVCAFINPWNYPLHQLIGKLAPALAAGCTVVVKPSQETPLHAFLLAEMIEAIGLPAGVFNLVSGPGRRSVSAGAAPVGGHGLVHRVHRGGRAGCPGCGAVGKAGVPGAGRQVAVPDHRRRTAGSGGAPWRAGRDDQLGADLYRTDAHAAAGLALCRGSGGRRGRGAQPGDGRPAGPTQLPRADVLGRAAAHGAGIHPDRRGRRRAATVRRATAAGFERGFFVPPTIFADVDNRMRIAQEEIFGPVLCLIPYADEAEAIALANDSPYGLSSAVWAASRDQALQLARQLRAGQCFVNGGAFNYQAPFGGYKQSGNGREWGEEGLNEFVEVKAIQL